MTLLLASTTLDSPSRMKFISVSSKSWSEPPQVASPANSVMEGYLLFSASRRVPVSASSSRVQVPSSFQR